MKEAKMNNKRTLVIKPLKNAKLVTWTKSILSKIKLSRDSRAGVVVDKDEVPQLFVFDTTAFLDILSAIDEALVDKLTDKEYNTKEINPAGWLIDEIEAKLPLNPEYIQSLRDAIDEANKKGWIPFSKVQKKLGLA